MMRIIVLVLAAANLLYFGWSQWVGRDRSALTAVAPGAAKPKPVAPRTPPAPPPCATVGPFNTELQVLQAQQLMESGGWGVLRREITEQSREGWWVFVRNTNSNQQARTLNRIRGAGLQDAFAMPDDAEFRVSVGIFSEESRAEDRAQRVQRLRLDAIVNERMRDTSRYWLDVPGIAAQTLRDGRLAATGLAVSSLRIEDCPPQPAGDSPTAAPAPEAAPAPASVPATGAP
jgi:hypothetical protein